MTLPRPPVETEFTVYATGICVASVCSSLPKLEVAQRMRREITGVGPWVPSKDKAFSGGEPNPCPCNTSPKTHKHYKFIC